MEATLYSIPASHPAKAVEGMLDLKGIPYKRRDLMPVISKGVLKAMGFPGTTIPSLRIDDRKLTGSREISRALDEIQAGAAALPGRRTRRAPRSRRPRSGARRCSPTRVRRILWNALKRDRNAARELRRGREAGRPDRSRGGDRRAGHRRRVPDPRHHRRPSARDLAAFPGWLDQIDEWISDGVLGGDQPNAADFQIAAALRLAMTLDDLRPAIEARPAGELALRLFPDYPGEAPPVLPGRVARAAASGGDTA